MKRNFILKLTAALCILLCTMFLFSCSAGSNKSQSKNLSTGNGYGSVSEDQDPVDPEKTEEYRKIIKNLQLDIEVENVEQAYETILKNAVALGGYEFERNMTKSGDYVVLNAVLKIPSDKLSDFTNQAETTGNVINNILKSEDITDQYFDAQTRLETLEKTLEKYYEFLQNAKNITEQLEITEKISDITNEIEALKGRMEKWDNQVDYSTVSLYLRQYDDPISIKKEIQWNSLSFGDMWYLIKSGFTSVTSLLVSALQWLVIILLSGIVVFLPIIILIFFLLWRKKKKQKK